MDYKDALLWCEQFEENILFVAPERDKMVLSLQAIKKCKEALAKQIEAEKPFLQITVDTELTAEVREILKSQQGAIITDTLEKTFVEGCEDLRGKGKGSDEILNWYRNLYYKEDANTERRIVAEALNDILPELVKLRDIQGRKMGTKNERVEHSSVSNVCSIVFNKMNYSDYVEIEHEGKKYVGRIKSVDSVWSEGRTRNGKAVYNIEFYNVSLIEKDTNCTISNIILKHFSDIKTYKGE